MSQPPVIAIEGLRYRYPSALPGREAEQVLRGVDLTVAQGEFLALMGPTGAGKTTLCLALNGIVPQSTGGVIGGRVTVLGHDARRTPVAQLARHVGIVYQDPESQLFCATVEAEVAFGPENLGLSPGEIAERVGWALDVVGMRRVRGRSPTRLSGGQKQRVAIAAALAMLPQVLILDEPTAALDPLGRLEVFRVIEQLRHDQNMTIVMVSQDPEHVAAFADRAALLADGCIVAEGAPADLFYELERFESAGVAAPQLAELSVALHRQDGLGRRFMLLDEAEAALRAGWPSPPAPSPASRRGGMELAEAPSGGGGGSDSLTDSPARAAGVPERSAPSLLLGSRSPAHGIGATCRGAPPLPLLGEGGGGEGQRPTPAVSARGLIYRYDPELPALEGVDLEIADNTYLGIIGQNGSGKTTLVKHFNGLLRPTEGRIEIFGRDASRASVGELAHLVGYVFQNPDHQIFCATTRGEIAFGPRNLGLGADRVRERVEDALIAFDLTAYADLPPAVLGYGLRRKVSIAAVYAMRPRLLILDEPTAGLDRRSADELMRLVDAMHAEGHTIVLVSHDMQLVATHCQQVLVMDEGRVLLEGPPEAVFAQGEALARASLAPPSVTALAQRLGDLGMPSAVLTVQAFCQAYGQVREALP